MTAATETLDREERRAHPRQLAKLRVQLLRSDTVPMQLRTVELSQGGMHLECDRSQSQLLVPPDKGEGLEFTARLLISEPGAKRRAITLKVAVVAVEQLAEDLFRVGFEIVQYFGKSREMLRDFIAKAQQ